MDDISKLEPKVLWKHFADLTRIPRGSGNEAAVVAFVEAEAKKRGLEVKRDAVGDLLIKVPASPGKEAAPVVVLQGHLDMVCEKNAGTAHDFLKDPIDTVIDGDWVKTNGTTLGADNGVGVAAALALMDDRSTVHGPLELLLTIDEETGMTGAMNLPAGFVTGRLLMNLDSEDDGVLFVGCAGGCNSEIKLTLRRDAPLRGFKALLVKVSGLQGGHSGLNIIENRANAVKLLVRLLLGAQDATGLRLGALNGGNKHNAIPREATAVVFVPTRKEAELRKRAAEFTKVVKEEFAGIEPGLALSIGEAPKERPKPITAAAGRRLLDLLAALPHGTLGMSRDIRGLVETSSNLAVADTEERAARIVCSSRSSVGPTLDGVLAGIAAVARLAGADCQQPGGYPAWKPNMSSKLLQACKATSRALYGKDPVVTAIHAGLETGIIGKRFPGMDMISFGPQLHDVHSPAERVQISSVARFYDYLKAVLTALAS